MRRASHTLIVLVALAVLVMGHAGSALAAEEYDMMDLLGEFSSGGLHAGADAYVAEEPGFVRVEFFNIADPTEPYTARVSPGTLLGSAEYDGDGYAVMIVVEDMLVDVPVETNGEYGFAAVVLPTLSAEMGEPLPPEGHGILPASLPRNMPELDTVVTNIVAQNAQSEEAAQLAVWYVTDGLDISDNPRAMELAGIELDVETDGDDPVPPVDGTKGGTGDGTDGDSGSGGETWLDDTSSGDRRAPSRGAVPPASAAAAGVVAAGLAAAAAAAGGGLSGFGSTAGNAGGGLGGAPAGAAGTAAPPQAPYQPVPGQTAPPDGAGGSGTVPSQPPTPPPQQPQAPQQPQTTDDIDLDRGLYDPNYAGSHATPDPGMGVDVDPDSYDPWAGQRSRGGEGSANIGPAPKEGEGPDITIDPESGDYGVDLGGRGVRISKTREGWNVGVGDRGVGPMQGGVPEFDASAGGFSVSNRGGEASVGITHGGGRSTTIALGTDEDLTRVTLGDNDDRTVLTKVRDRWGVKREIGSGDDPSRAVAGQYDTESGDFAAGQIDRRGAVIVSKEGDRVGVGWSSARGKPGMDDDFSRGISIDPSSGDFDAHWGDINVSVGDDVYSVGSGKRGITWDTDTDSGILTFGPSDGSRQTTIGAGDGDYILSTRIPARIGGKKIDFDVMVNSGMRWTANEDMMPEMLTGGSEEYWVGIKNDWLMLRGGRVNQDPQVWFGITRRLGRGR